jgi:uncharacterized membrane protein (UPF0136 family)
MPADTGHYVVVSKSLSSFFAGIAAAAATAALAASAAADPAPPIVASAVPPIAPPLAMVALWIYVTLLMAGGLAGFIKAGSRISLVTSALSAALLALCATGIIKPFYIAKIILAVLAVVFGARYWKSSKFMPSGLILLFSVVVLAVLVADR